MRLKKRAKRVCVLGCIVILVLLSVAFGATGDWTTYTNMNHIEEVLLKGEELWCATTGGIVILNTNDKTYIKLTNVEDLGGNEVYAVEIDSAGNFWFGAQNGTLTKYTPEEGSWKVHNFIDRDGSRLRINDIAADGDRLWIATSKALSLFLIYKHGGEIKETYRRLGEQMEGGEEVNSVHLVGERIWAATEAGVACADKNDPNLLDFSRWMAFTEESSPGLDNDLVHSITEADGQIVVGTEAGVFKFESLDSTWQSLGLTNRRINDLKYLHQRLYAATNAGIYVYEDETWTRLTESGLLTKNFNSIARDEDGTLWAGTAGQGVSSLASDSLAWQNHVTSGPPANLFVDMETDDQGNLWCAQEMYGASLFDGSTWTSLSSVPEIDGFSIRAIKRDLQDNLWFTSWGAGVIKYDPEDKAWIRYTEKNSPFRGIAADPEYVVVNDVAVDEMGNRWFPNWEALDSTRIVCSPTQNETSWTVFYIRDGINSELLLSVFASEGHLYVCTRDEGLVDYYYNWTPENKNDDQVTHYTPEQHRLSHETVLCANVDRDGTLWVGTSGGLDKFDPDWGKFSYVPLPDPLGPQVNDIEVDARNNKWIATTTGLGMMNSKGEFVGIFTTFNSKICGNNVLGLKIDGRTGNVWVGTDNGLSRFESGIGAPAKELSDVVPFPNPFIIENGSEILTFDRLPYEATVRIFTIAGELVKKIKSGNQWNGRNEGGELVASGIYLFHVHGSSGESAVGKIAVVRK